MKAVVLQGPGEFRLLEAAPPGEPGEGQALVRVRRIGICGTDLHAFDGSQPFLDYPRILGHELGVEVVAVGENALGLRPGDACVVEPYFSCGHCIACRRGKTNCCTDMQVLGVHMDGGMQEYILLPASSLLKSATLTFEQLALVETLSIGAHALAQAGLQPQEPILVVGAGPIGMSIIASARAAGHEVSVLEPNPIRVEFCRRHLGVRTFVDPCAEPISGLKAALGGDLPTAIFDATGNRRSMMSTFKYAAHGAKLVFVGFSFGEISFDNPEFHRRELTLIGSRNATRADLRRCISLLEQGKIDTAPWITHRLTLEQLPGAFPRLLDPASGVIKALVAA